MFDRLFIEITLSLMDKIGVGMKETDDFDDMPVRRNLDELDLNSYRSGSKRSQFNSRRSHI